MYCKHCKQKRTHYTILQCLNLKKKVDNLKAVLMKVINCIHLEMVTLYKFFFYFDFKMYIIFCPITVNISHQ